MAYYYPRHALRILAVLEDFTGNPTRASSARDWVVVPRSARLERNDLRTADKLVAEVDFHEFPFDPRLIRTAAVAYYAGDTNGGALARDERTLRFLGTLDSPEAVLGDDALKVTLECRDYTAFLLDKKATAAMQVPLDRGLREILVDLLATLPGEQATLLRPVLHDALGTGLEWPTVHGGGRRGARLPVEPKDTLWSVILRVVQMTGLVCWVELDTLVVSTPRNATASSRPTRFAFGHNLSDLRLKRNTQNLTRPVALTQYDPASGLRTTAVYPPEPRAGRSGGGRGRGRGQRAHAALSHAGRASTGTQDAQPEEFNITGHRTEAQLLEAAEQAYRDRAKTEIEGSLTTHELRVGGTDVYELTAGDLIRAEVDEHTRAAFEGARDTASRERYLLARGYPPAVAGALAQSWEHLDRVALPFSIRKATLALDDRSFQLDIDFQNLLTPFVEGEVEPDATTRGEEVDNRDATTVTTRRPR